MADDTAEVKTTDKTKESGGSPVFSEEQQAFINDLVGGRVNEIRTKYEAQIKEIETKHAKELELSRMDEKTRAEAEEKQRISDLTKRAESAERALRVASAEKELAKAGLPTDLAETIMGDDEAQMVRNVAALDKVVKERANALYAERVGSAGAPPAPDRGQVSDLTARLRQAAGLSAKEG